MNSKTLFFYLLIISSLVVFNSCQKEPLEKETEFEAIEGLHYELDNFQSKSNTTENLKIATFNTASASKSELQTFKSNLPSGINVICFQEVKNPNEILEVFASGPDYRDENSYSSFPYVSIAKKRSTKQRLASRRKTDYQVIISKFPIIKQAYRKTQKDPHGDQWERFAQYVKLQVNTYTSVHLFNYHNTNRLAGVTPAETGMTEFRKFINDMLGLSTSSISDLGTRSNLFIVGDLNLSESGTEFTFLQNTLGATLDYSKDWLDYVVSSETASSSGEIDLPTISDHDVLWASYPISTNRNNAFSNTVRMYEHSSFRGRMATFERGYYYDITNIHPLQYDADFWNDRISSIRVGGQVRASAYEHSSYNGRVYYLPYQSGSSGFLNDAFTSLKVLRR